MILKKWKRQNKRLASLLLFCSSVFINSCSRFRNKEPKKIPTLEVYVPLEEDYPLLTRGVFILLENAFPKAKIKLKEGLSDKYDMAPFADWLTKADADGILRLQIQVDKFEDLAPLLTFLKSAESKIPFKVKVPSPQTEAPENKGEALFCKMRIEGQDLYEKQLCKELHAALCGKDLRNSSKRLGGLGPSCQLRLFKPEVEAESKSKPKLFFLTGFPLPIKVKNDYPLSRFGEVEEAMLLNLFQDSVSDLEAE